MNGNFYLCVFPTRNIAMLLYSILEAKGFEVFRLVTAPCGIKAACNYAIKFKSKWYLDVIVKEAKELDIEVPDIYYAERVPGKYKYTKVNIN